MVFRNFTGVSAGVIFYPLESNRGSVFLLPLQPPQYWRVKAGIFTNFRKIIMPGEKPVCVRTSPETQQLVKEMCPLDSCRLLFKLAVELDMVMNVLAAGMEIPDEQLRTLRVGASRI